MAALTPEKRAANLVAPLDIKPFFRSCFSTLRFPPTFCAFLKTAFTSEDPSQNRDDRHHMIPNLSRDLKCLLRVNWVGPNVPYGCDIASERFFGVLSPTKKAVWVLGGEPHERLHRSLTPTRAGNAERGFRAVAVAEKLKQDRPTAAAKGSALPTVRLEHIRRR